MATRCTKFAISDGAAAMKGDCDIGFRYDVGRRVLLWGGGSAAITVNGAKILLLLFAAKGNPVAYERIILALYPATASYMAKTSLTIAVCRLRAKINLDPSPLANVWGHGFRWTAPVVVIGEAPLLISRRLVPMLKRMLAECPRRCEADDLSHELFG
jgi:hypothetical protein